VDMRSLRVGARDAITTGARVSFFCRAAFRSTAGPVERVPRSPLAVIMSVAWPDFSCEDRHAADDHQLL
jgi:hypothetical protein